MQRFVNLLSVATADGRLSEREVKFLSQRAHEWGLSDHQFAIAVNRSLEHPGELQIPRRREERAELLRDMLRIMASDGKLLDVEKQLFAVVATRMRFSATEIDAIIDELVGNEVRGAVPESQKAGGALATQPAAARKPGKSKAATSERPPQAQAKAKVKAKPKAKANSEVRAKATSGVSSAPKKKASKKAPPR